MPPGINWPSDHVTFGDANIVGPAFAVMLGVVVAWIAAATLTAWLAGRKHRDSGLWFVLGFFTGPVALIAICLMRPSPRHD